MQEIKEKKSKILFVITMVFFILISISAIVYQFLDITAGSFFNGIGTIAYVIIFYPVFSYLSKHFESNKHGYLITCLLTLAVIFCTFLFK